MTHIEDRHPDVKPAFFASLVYPDFRRLIIATATAQSAAWALIVLRGALIYDMTGSNSWVGVVTMAALLPALVVTPLSGLLADRYDRRKVLACAISLNLAHNVVLGFLVISGTASEHIILGLAIINGSIRALELPTNQALLPNLVPKERLFNAVATSQLVRQGSRMAGPLLMLPIISFVDPEPAFFMSAGLYAVSLTQVLRIRVSSKGVISRGQGALFNLMAGVRFIYSNPILMSIVLLTVVHCALTMAFESLFPFFSRSQLGLEQGRALFQGPTYLMIAVGAGAIVSNLALTRVESHKTRGRLVLWLGILSGLTPVALAFSTTVPVAMLASALLGAATAGFMTVSHGIIQMLTTDDIRGRVMAANTWHVLGAMGGFNAINGVLMDVSWMTPTLLLVGTGIIFLWVMVGSFATAPLRSIYAKGLSPEMLPK